MAACAAFERCRAELESAPPAATEAFDWRPAFAEAGLDYGRFQPADPRWIPSDPFDMRAEWTGSMAQCPEIPLTVSAAAFRGRLVHFRVLGPWSKPERMEPVPLSPGLAIGNTTLAVTLLIMLVGSASFARRNLRRGRGDRAGALHLGAFTAALGALQYFVDGRWAGDVHTWLFGFFIPGIGAALTDGAILWLIYLALEPYMRRRMPELLIGWARLLEGRFRDPRVGRDVLIGALFGTAAALVTHAVSGVSAWFPFGGETTVPSYLLYEKGGTNPLSYLLAVPLFALEPGVGNLAWYFLLSVLLRRKGLAVAALGVVFVLLSLGGENVALEMPAAVLLAVLLSVVVVRFGMLSNVAFWFFYTLLTVVPPSLDLSSWYGLFALPGMLLGGAIILYSFRISVGNQPLFAAALDD